jgi:hypothetical protein
MATLWFLCDVTQRQTACSSASSNETKLMYKRHQIISPQRGCRVLSVSTPSRQTRYWYRWMSTKLRPATPARLGLAFANSQQATGFGIALAIQQQKSPASARGKIALPCTYPSSQAAGGGVVALADAAAGQRRL